MMVVYTAQADVCVPFSLQPWLLDRVIGRLALASSDCVWFVPGAEIET